MLLFLRIANSFSIPKDTISSPSVSYEKQGASPNLQGAKCLDSISFHFLYIDKIFLNHVSVLEYLDNHSQPQTDTQVQDASFGFGF